MFITGLHEPIRKEIMKCTYANFMAVYEATLDLEIIKQDNKATKPIKLERIASPPLNTTRTKLRPSMLSSPIEGNPLLF